VPAGGRGLLPGAERLGRGAGAARPAAPAGGGGMSWLNPAGAWWLLLLPALVALYLFRTRPYRRRVSSLRLWQRLPDVDRPQAQLRPPPRSPLLLLQALLLLAGALALIQPALSQANGRHLVLL